MGAIVMEALAGQARFCQYCLEIGRLQAVGLQSIYVLVRDCEAIDLCTACANDLRADELHRVETGSMVIRPLVKGD